MTKKARPYSLLIVYSKAFEETEMVLALEFMRKYVGKFEMRPLQWWAESAPPPGGDRVKVSENSVATSVAPVAPVDISLSTKWINESTKIVVREQRKRRTACITQ